jgi:hypothetical protein
VTIGVLLCLIIITGRIIIQKQHDDAEESSKDEPKFHKSNTGETTITKGFSGDNICDMEGGDIDLTTPMGISSLPAKNEVILMNLHDDPHQGLQMMSDQHLGFRHFRRCRHWRSERRRFQ